MQIEKELIYLDPHSFERIEDYLDCIDDMQLKLGKCGKGQSKKDGNLIDLVLMNLQMTYDVFSSSFHTNSGWSNKEDGKDYSFDIFCDLLIRDKLKLLN